MSPSSYPPSNPIHNTAALTRAGCEQRKALLKLITHVQDCLKMEGDDTLRLALHNYLVDKKNFPKDGDTEIILCAKEFWEIAYQLTQSKEKKK